MEYERLSGSEKAGILMLSLPEEQTREFLNGLEDHEVERVLSAVARFDRVPPELQRRIIAEFQSTLGNREVAIHGGHDRAREIAQRTLGADRAQRVLENLGEDEKRIDWTLRAYSPAFIAETIADEHPQTISLIISQLPADRGAAVIGALSEDIRSEVVLSLAELESVTTDVIAELEEGVAELFGRPVGSETRVGGADVAAKLLNSIAKSEGAAILDGLNQRDPDLAGRIRSRMLTFNELVCLENRDMQMLMREVSTEDLVVALRTASDEMKEKVFSNLSKRASEQLREEMDLQGPVKISEVEAAQREIVETARRLEEEGQITIEVGESADVLV